MRFIDRNTLELRHLDQFGPDLVRHLILADLVIPSVGGATEAVDFDTFHLNFLFVSMRP